MGYAHIGNLYKDQDILAFKKCYALEKIHGSSAWISLKQGGELEFYAGGESDVNFRALFDYPSLLSHMQSLGSEEAVIYGEVYGGSIQRMSQTYGDRMYFTAFDVKIGGLFLAVPQMAELLTSFGLDVVPYELIDTEMSAIDAQRDAPSVVSVRRGVVGPKQREGVVLRPPFEVTKNNGERVIAKHKADKYAERAKNPKVEDPNKLAVLANAQAIADEWVTPMRLEHVLQKLPPDLSMKDVVVLIRAMQEDVTREAAGEIVVSKEALTAIGKKAVELFKQRVV